jgi:DNA repair protein RecN (Recombination protein N)
VLANATKLAEAAHVAEQALYGGEGAATDLVAQAHTRLAEASALDPKLTEPLEMIAAARANLEEAAHSLRSYAARSEADPARLEQIDARLQELNRVARKYGGSIEAAIETLERSRKEIVELEAIADSRAETAAELDRALDQLVRRAELLSARRQRDGAELRRRMETELKTLGMRSAVFEARLGRISDNAALVHGGYALDANGFDTVEFYLAPNLGQPPMPLGRIASGGELSRVMLSLKRLEAQRRGLSTMIFDEVDAGIGGAVAEIVGRKLKQLARFHQILCVTHLAQIAAFADSHFVVEKEERRGSTRSLVSALERADRTAEIARMIGGDTSSEKFLRAARELLNHARV